MPLTDETLRTGTTRLIPEQADAIAEAPEGVEVYSSKALDDAPD